MFILFTITQKCERTEANTLVPNGRQTQVTEHGR